LALFTQFTRISRENDKRKEHFAALFIFLSRKNKLKKGRGRFFCQFCLCCHRLTVNNNPRVESDDFILFLFFF
jgi:hypothetical protein